MIMEGDGVKITVHHYGAEIESTAADYELQCELAAALDRAILEAYRKVMGESRDV